MKLQGSRVLGELLECKSTGRALEGGSRSTKTWSLIQWYLLYCQENYNKGKEITVTRDRLTWLKATVLKDFQEILKLMGWWNEKNFQMMVR